MLPSARQFAEAMGELGIRKDDTVVVYDTKELGIFSAPRVAWTLRVFGHNKVHILNNFKLWVEQGYPTESGELYNVDCNPYPIPKVAEERVASFEEVKEAAQEGRLVEMFGAGTAAVISPVDRIGYMGEDVHIPTGPDGMGPVSRPIWTELVGRQWGKIPSDWSVPIVE